MTSNPHISPSIPARKLATSRARATSINSLLEDIESIKLKVEVVIPVLNEEKTIGSIIEQAQFYADEIIIIDGGSIDRTIEIAKEKDVKIIVKNERGKGLALREAFQKVNGGIVIMLDADGSMIPSEIPRFVREINLGADIVKGSRFMYGGGSKDINLIRRFGNSIFVILVNSLFGLKITDLCYGYMAFTKNAINKLNGILNSKGFDIETEIILKANKLGLKIVEIPSLELKRQHGRSKLNTFKDGFKILLKIIKEFVRVN